jgi:tRNA-2-methylthio-N6-dimethylallyladenosine synthase
MCVQVYLETYGCQMNEYDSELVRSILRQERFEIAATAEEADVVLLNTCAIREHAHQKIYGRVRGLAPLRRRKPRLVVGILGCMAQNLKDELLRDPSGIDLVAGPDAYKKLPGLIREVWETGQKGKEIDLSEYETYSDVYPERVPGVNAWIACMRGCDNFCTFCVVPYTRGRERSRSVQSIVEETRRLAEQGYKQVTLLGQNVNSYGHEGHDFADLLLAVAEIDGIRRVRFTSPHPRDFPRRLLHAIASHPKLCKQIHLPLQAGNDRVLELMRRTYTRAAFLDLVAEIRDTIPGVCLSTDVIGGFPTETEAEFEDTVAVMQQVEFDSAFIFKYSERLNTIAQRRIPDDVPEAVKSSRVVRLNEVQKAISLRRNRAWVGRTLEVLLEGPSRKSPDDLLGRDDGNHGVVLPRGALRPGDLVPVRIREASAHTLLGTAAPVADPVGADGARHGLQHAGGARRWAKSPRSAYPAGPL